MESVKAIWLSSDFNLLKNGKSYEITMHQKGRGYSVIFANGYKANGDWGSSPFNPEQKGFWRLCEVGCDMFNGECHADS